MLRQREDPTARVVCSDVTTELLLEILDEIDDDTWRLIYLATMAFKIPITVLARTTGIPPSEIRRVIAHTRALTGDRLNRLVTEVEEVGPASVPALWKLAENYGIIDLLRCGHCGGNIGSTTGRGRPSQYCSTRCRQAAYRARNNPVPARSRDTTVASPGSRSGALEFLPAERAADELRAMPPWQAAQVLREIPLNRAAAIMTNLTTAEACPIIERIPAGRVAAPILARVTPCSAAALLNSLRLETAQAIIAGMSDARMPPILIAMPPSKAATLMSGWDQGRMLRIFREDRRAAGAIIAAIQLREAVSIILGLPSNDAAELLAATSPAVAAAVLTEVANIQWKDDRTARSGVCLHVAVSAVEWMPIRYAGPVVAELSDRMAGRVLAVLTSRRAERILASLPAGKEASVFNQLVQTAFTSAVGIVAEATVGHATRLLAYLVPTDMTRMMSALPRPRLPA
jgi:flagellar motility protein MotE (MotC chaperone)